MEDLVFDRGEASLSTLKTQTDAILASLNTEEGRAELAAAGFDPSSLREVTFSFATREAGVFGVGESVVVSVVATHLAPVAKQVLLDLWKTVVLPKIRRRFGEDAIGAPRLEKKQTPQKGAPKARGAKTAGARAPVAEPKPKEAGAKRGKSGGKPRARS